MSWKALQEWWKRFKTSLNWAHTGLIMGGSLIDTIYVILKTAHFNEIGRSFFDHLFLQDRPLWSFTWNRFQVNFSKIIFYITFIWRLNMVTNHLMVTFYNSCRMTHSLWLIFMTHELIKITLRSIQQTEAVKNLHFSGHEVKWNLRRTSGGLTWSWTKYRSNWSYRSTS